MLFGLSKKRIITDEVLYINNEIITNVKSTKFLGVTIDCKISWAEHIHYIKCKISKGIDIICKARKVLQNPHCYVFIIVLYIHILHIVFKFGWRLWHPYIFTLYITKENPSNYTISSI